MYVVCMCCGVLDVLWCVGRPRVEGRGTGEHKGEYTKGNSGSTKAKALNV